MLEKIFVVAAFVFGMSFPARAQLTNQVAITSSLTFELLEGSTFLRTNCFEANEQIIYSVASTDGNGHVFALLPADQTFIFVLHDSAGKIVAKSAKGLEMSKPVDTGKSVGELHIKHHPIDPNRSLFNNLFVPDDYFTITRTGTYTLDVQMRAWVQETNKQYGVVVSPPVHVLIEKK